MQKNDLMLVGDVSLFHIFESYADKQCSLRLPEGAGHGDDNAY